MEELSKNDNYLNTQLQNNFNKLSSNDDILSKEIESVKNFGIASQSDINNLKQKTREMDQNHNARDETQKSEIDVLKSNDGEMKAEINAID